MIHDRSYRVAEKRGNEPELEARMAFNAYSDHCYLNTKSSKYTWKNDSIDI